MLHEHAITYSQQMSVGQLDYMVKKAYRLGTLGREIVGVHEEFDDEGTHIFFDVKGYANECKRTS